MNFDKLPAELVATIISKCNYDTVAKVRETSSLVNKLIKGYHYDKLVAGQIMFRNNYYKLGMIVTPAKFRESCCFTKGFKIPEQENCVKPRHHIMYEKIKEVLTNVKSMRFIEFCNLNIDETFLPMLKSLPFDWRTIEVRFLTCDYVLGTEDLLPLWKMFKKVDEMDSKFYEKRDVTNIINDELIVQTLPHIVFNSIVCFCIPGFFPNPAVTDVTLEFLAENRPAYISMRRFIYSFTVEGIEKFFKRIVNSRDSTIEKWFIGIVQFDTDTTNRLIDYFDYEYNSEFSNCTIIKYWHRTAYGVKVDYKKVNSDEVGSILVALIKPPTIIEEEMALSDAVFDRTVF